MSGSAGHWQTPRAFPSTGSPTSPALLPCLAAGLQSIHGSAGTAHQVDPAVGLLAPQLRAPAHVSCQGCSPTPAAGSTDSQAGRHTGTHTGGKVPCWRWTLMNWEADGDGLGKTGTDNCADQTLRPWVCVNGPFCSLLPSQTPRILPLFSSLSPPLRIP